ncbi:MAG: hypothetical protein DME04_04050 [Candidatus Rokuibacteriota bacterium]|nr:MAG: hypothetical protein DME04_04050 [Candidatus Rokubacteria bacterium]
MTNEAPPESFGLSTCSKPPVAPSNNPVARDLRAEFRDLVFDVCRVQEDYKQGGFGGRLERQFGTVQELIADVFTGRGLHPTIGSIVPESGTALGLALNDEWHIRETPHTRFTTSVEARGSENGFWAAGAVSHMQFDWYRAYDVGSFRMPQVTVAVKHFDLPEMPFYGLGNQTSLRNRSLFGLTETQLPVLVDLPIAYGLTLSAQATALYATSDPSRAFVSRFSESEPPGARARTTYAVPGLIATYRSPDALYGLSGEARVSYEAYEALAGGPFSFDRFEARMAMNYGIEDQPFSQGKFPYLRSLLGGSRFSAEANLVISEPRAHSAVPFYLQPTLGGGDIHNENWLRSYTNYRFRAPNMVAYAVTYELRLIDPIGFLIYAQWGKVGLNVGELDFDRLKRSIGVGIALRLGGRSVAEFSFAWGGGEGTQRYSTGNTNNAIGFGARAAGTVGLRGVF